DQAINNQIKIEGGFTWQSRLFSQIIKRSIDPHANKTGLAEFPQCRGEIRPLLQTDRREHLHSTSFRERADIVNDLRYAMVDSCSSALKTVGSACPRVEYSQIIGNLGHRTDGRKR